MSKQEILQCTFFPPNLKIQFSGELWSSIVRWVSERIKGGNKTRTRSQAICRTLEPPQAVTVFVLSIVVVARSIKLVTARKLTGLRQISSEFQANASRPKSLMVSYEQIWNKDYLRG